MRIFIIATLKKEMSTLNYSQTLELCSHSFAFSNEKTRTRRVENDKLLNQMTFLLLNMKNNYFKKNLIAFIFLSCFLLPINIQAQSKTTYGVVDCGSWLNKSNQALELSNNSWVLGYLTAMNMSGKYPKNFLEKIKSANQIFVYLDNFCQKFPLENVVIGSGVLINELLKQD